MLECVECGFTDPDVTFFYLGAGGEHYCSLHLPCLECGVIHDEEDEAMTIKEEGAPL